jgi:hypothetical protein
LKDIFSPNIFMVSAKYASASWNSQTKEIITKLTHFCHIK